LLYRLLGELLSDVEKIHATKADEGHEAKGSLPTRHLLCCLLVGLNACFSSLSLLHKCLLRLGGFAPFFGKGRFNGSQPTLHVFQRSLRLGGFAPFLLECIMLCPFGSALLFCFCMNHML
jgi:hypothetical protein